MERRGASVFDGADGVDSSDVFDVVVVGSGIAGLAAARRLVLAGQRVAVLERGAELGGHLLPFRRGHQLFEVGLHYLADCGPNSHWQKAMDELKIALVTDPLDSRFERVVTESAGSASSGGSGNSRNSSIVDSFCFPFSRYQVELEEQFPDERDSLRRYFEDLALIWDFAQGLQFPLRRGALARQVLRHFAGKPRQLFRLLRILSLSAQDYFTGHLALPSHVAEYLLLQHLLIGCDPLRMSALMYLLVHRYYFEEPCFVRGGGQAMIAALMHSDVEYVRESPVLAIETLETGAQERGYLVKTPQRRWRCRNLIWTPDPRLLQTCVRFELPLLFRARMSRASAPHALVVGYFGTKAALEDLGFANANYWLKGTMTAAECYRETSLERLVQHAPLYVSMGSLREQGARDPGGRDPGVRGPGVREQGRGVFQAMFLVPPDWQLWANDGTPTHLGPEGYRRSAAQGGFRRDYLGLKKDVLERLSARLQRAFPSLQGALVWQELGTPLTHHRYLNSKTLGGYGFAPTVEDLVWGRPEYDIGREGLFLAGAFTLPSHGILTSLLSGLGVGRHLAEGVSKIPTP